MAVWPRERNEYAASTEDARPEWGEWKVGLRASPELADHAVQGAAVLPGAYYIAKALEASSDLGSRLTVRNVSFQRPVVLYSSDSVIRARIRPVGEQQIELTFFESASTSSVASLRIDASVSPLCAESYDASFVREFQRQAQHRTDRSAFYASLNGHGNEYGPAFQRIVSIWHSRDECVARLDAHESRRTDSGIDVALIDSMTQLLSVFMANKGQTYLLRSIDTIAVVSTDFPTTLWGHASLRPERAAGNLVGDVRIFDETGRTHVELNGVSLATFEHQGTRAGQRAMHFAVAANFTAEPCEDALQYWGRHFDVSVRTEFAPYNQVFQQLLDPQSVLRRNRDGINVILLSLEELLGGAHALAPVDQRRVDESLGAHPRRTLPNGMEVAELNRYETDYLYKEIFEERCYVRHGIELNDEATVIDIGANIGMFSLFVARECPTARIYAFEPAPRTCDILEANCNAYSDHVRVVNAGVADAAKRATFTFYEKSSVFSGFHPDEAEDRAAIQAVVENALIQEGNADRATATQLATDLTAERLTATTHQCQLTTVSEIIRAHGIQVIDLLKIDAEKSELAILRGIEDADWPRIRQIVLEVHDRTGEVAEQIRQLLASKGFECAVQHERALDRSGLFNLYATRPSGARHEGHRLERTVRELGAALETFAANALAPTLLCVCPSTAGADAACIHSAEQGLLRAVTAVPNVTAISSAELLERYPVRELHDPYANRAGRVPYTQAGFAAIGTAVFRRALALKRAPYKVIVLDCDNTLWNGVCGEDGSAGVDCSGAYARLQKFILDQMRAGMLLAICSKNNKADVDAVFASGNGMPLRREHIAAWRVNWNSKPDNLQSLAKELNIGLESIVVIDDSATECAEIRARCPGVLCLQLPQEPDRIDAFLAHAWVFDHAGTTDEDRSRTQLYQDNARREQFRAEAMSLADFIDGLELRVSVEPAIDAEIDRLSQLTCRTNQFNLTTVRRSAVDIRDFLNRPDSGCFSVRVADRFGDYGLVGAVLWQQADDRLVVDSFLLSCRVLGRGVEHQVVASLGRHALAGGAKRVDVAFRSTEKNAPARMFLEELTGCTVDGSGVHTFDAERLSRVQYDPHRGAYAEPPHSPAERGSPRSTQVSDNLSERLRVIAERSLTADEIAEEITSARAAARADDATIRPASSDTAEGALLGIWGSVLGRTRIGLHDNFFDLGGTSLKAVQVVSAIRKELGRDVSIVTLFESPSVALLAARLGAADDSADDRASEMMARGKRRKPVSRTRAV